jgi:N-acetylglucosamine-6-phosphate deacetylase
MSNGIASGDHPSSASFPLVVENLFDGDRWLGPTAVTVAEGRVAALEPAAGRAARPGSLVPGFIDAQVNGGGGALFNDQPTAATLGRIGAAHARFGTTAFLPTLISDSYDTMARAADAVAQALRSRQPGVLGVHFEGPHLSLEKRGVHAPAALRPLADAELALFARADLGVRVVTLAPETVAPEDIRRLVALGVRVCLGHSGADFATVRRALEAGASGFTHLYNAMSPLTAREPGMVGAALLDRDSWCGVILDGCHVHDASALVALKAKGPGKVVWVTDAMPPVGTDADAFTLHGQPITRRGLELRDARGALAGSVLDMATAVRSGVTRLALPLEESLRMASRYPAEWLRLGPDYGRIAVGARADLVLIDGDVHARATYIAGELVT